MENKLIIGNFKTNMKYGEIANYIKHFKNINNKNVVICPSYIYISYFLENNFSVGSQNVSSVDDCTGEISAEQLASMGVEYTIIGHSERRINLNETNIEINKKIKNSLKSKLKVILCIGETLEEFKLLKKETSLKRQIRDALFDIADLKDIIIAYEPIWSIGTNNIPDIRELEDTIIYIKKLINSMYKQNIKVIYGGSINEDNIERIQKVKNLDGFLLGSSSINPLQFTQIIEKII